MFAILDKTQLYTHKISFNVDGIVYALVRPLLLKSTGTEGCCKRSTFPHLPPRYTMMLGKATWQHSFLARASDGVWLNLSWCFQSTQGDISARLAKATLHTGNFAGIVLEVSLPNKTLHKGVPCQKFHTT